MTCKTLRLLIVLCGMLAALPVAAQTAEEYQGLYDEDFDDEDFALIADPFESFNRAMFAFNDRLYFYVLKPVVRVYRHVPQPARRSVGNFFDNVRAPVRIVNSLLQLKLIDAGNELLRFGVNSTVGVAGLFDPARRYFGLHGVNEDLGQTLGHYGVGQGFYLVVPIFGPTTLRDGIGGTVDGLYLDPIVVYVDDNAVSAGLYGWNMVNAVSLDRDTYETITREAFDPYSFIRDAYVQRRAAEVAR